MGRKLYTTGEVAQLVDISRQTLHEWIKAGRVKAPTLRIVKSHTARLWSARDVLSLRALKKKTYRRATVPGRGRPVPGRKPKKRGRP